MHRHNKLRFYIISFLLGGHSLCASAEEWTDASTQLRCISEIQDAQDRLAYINNVWLAPASPTTNIFERFVDLNSKKSDILLRIETYMNKKATPNDTDAVKTEDLIRDQMEIVTLIKESNSRDTGFHTSLDAISKSLISIANQYKALAGTCGTQAESIISKGLKSVISLHNLTRKLQSYSAVSSSKKFSMLEVFMHGNHAEQSHLSNPATIPPETWLHTINLWWSEAHGLSGLASGIMGKYLQRQYPLQHLKLAYIEGIAIRNEVIESTRGLGSVSNIVLSEINQRLESLKNSIDELESNDKNIDLFLLQKSSTAARRNYLVRSMKICLPALDAFSATANPNNGPATYTDRHNAEMVYVTVVNSCQRKN